MLECMYPQCSPNVYLEDYYGVYLMYPMFVKRIMQECIRSVHQMFVKRIIMLKCTWMECSPNVCLGEHTGVFTQCLFSQACCSVSALRSVHPVFV